MSYDNSVSWGDMMMEKPVETTEVVNNRIVKTILAELAELPAYERTRDNLVFHVANLLSDKTTAENSEAVLEDVVRGITAASLEVPFDPYDLPTEEEEILDGWTMPNLEKRSSIWHNFPVSVVPYSKNSGDGKDRYKIVWKNEDFMQTWRLERSMSMDEYSDYEYYCEFRLRHALAAHSDIYTVEDCKQTGMTICIIAVEAEENFETPMVKMPTAVKKVSVRIVDVLLKFPVTWKQNGDVFDVRIHYGKCPKKSDQLKMIVHLQAALETCTDYETTMYPKGSDFICRVTKKY